MLTPASITPTPTALLAQSLLGAVADAIQQRTGKPSGALFLQPSSADAGEAVDPADLALAIAYLNLLLDDPETITQQHLKMLRSRFSVEQIHELNRFIKEKTSA